MEPVKVARQDGCSLQVVAETEADKLRIRYAFSNGSAKAAFLFNRLHGPGPLPTTFNTSVDLAYVEIGPAGAKVSKAIPPVPERTDVVKPMIPLLTRVAPGSRFEETFHLPLPLKPKAHYGQPPKELSPPRDTALSFELGYFLAPPEGEKLLKTVKTTEGDALRAYPFPITSQALFVAKLPIKVPAAAGKP